MGVLFSHDEDGESLRCFGASEFALEEECVCSDALICLRYAVMDVGGSLGLEEVLFDAVIVGTGLPESILSAALSLSGARVLHIDSNAFYGSHHASLPLRDIHVLSEKSASRPATAAVTELKQAVDLKPVFGEYAKVAPIRMAPAEMQAFPNGCRSHPGSETFVCEQGRHITLDLAARTVLAAGSLVDLLVQTGVGHYLSFRPLDATYMHLSSPSLPCSRGALQKVPASRSDVFQNKSLSMVEKRLLMRFLKSQAELSLNGDLPPAEFREATVSSKLGCDDSVTSFKNLLTKAKLTGTLCEFVRHCIAFTEDISQDDPDGVSASAGCAAVRTYLKSLLRYQTPTPFLYPNHGAGEICEAFCRLSAVHGGTFILRKELSAIVFISPESEQLPEANVSPTSSLSSVCGLVTTDGDLLRTRHVYVSSTVCGVSTVDPVARSSREWKFMCILPKSAFPQDSPRALSVFPRGCCGNVGATVRVLQLNSTVEMCPEGMFLVYAEVVGAEGSESDIACALGTLVTFSADDEERFEDGLRKARAGQMFGEDGVTASHEVERPNVAWSLWYVRHEGGRNRESEIVRDGLLGGLSVVKDIGVSVDGAKAVAEAKRCFELTRPAGDFFSPSTTASSGGHGTEDLKDEPHQVE